jgi:hypothetical protein
MVSICEIFELETLTFVIANQDRLLYFLFDKESSTITKCNSFGEVPEVVLPKEMSPHRYIYETIGRTVSAPSTIHVFDGRKLKDLECK